MSTATAPVIPESLLDLLESTALAYVSTIGPTGEPQVNPVWFGWDGTNLQIVQPLTRQKLRNLKRDPRIAVAIVDPATPGRYLEIRGVARLEPDRGLALTHRLVKKYLGLDQIPDQIGSEERFSVIVEPRHITHR